MSAPEIVYHGQDMEQKRDRLQEAVLGVHEQMDAEGDLEHHLASAPEARNLGRTGVSAVTFGPPPSANKPHIVQFSPAGNDPEKQPHRMLKAVRDHRLLVKSQNGDDDITFTVYGARDYRGISSDIGGGKGGMEKFGFRVIFSDLRRADIGRIALDGPSQGGSAALATGSSPAMRRHADIIAINASLDPRVQRPFGGPLGLAVNFGRHGADEFDEHVDAGEMDLYREGLDQDSQAKFLLSLASKPQWAYIRAMARRRVADDIVSLRTAHDFVNRRVDASNAFVLLTSATNDTLSPFAALKAEHERAKQELDHDDTSTVLAEVVDGHHASMDDMKVSGEIFLAGTALPTALAHAA